HPSACSPRPTRRPSDGRERAIVLGGEGCPEIVEFAPAEFGAMIGISAGAAADFIGQALALRHRLPLTWARVQSGQATPWKARKIAAACLDLSEDAARTVDHRVAKVVDTLTPGRLDRIVEAAKKHADPEAARAKAAERARERGVYLGRCDEHGTKKIFIRTGSGAAIRFDARITSIAEALKILGDTACLQRRRADAVGIIADPRYTEELLHQAHQHLAPTPPTATAAPAPTTAPTSRPAASPVIPAADQPPTRTAAATTRSAAPVVALDVDQASVPTADATSRAAAPAVTDQAPAPTVGAASRSATPPVVPAAGQAPALAADRISGAAAGRAIDDGEVTTADLGPARTKPATLAPERGAERGVQRRDHARDGERCAGWPDEDGLLTDWGEPGPYDEADRDAPHPGDSDLPDPFDTPAREPIEAFDPGLCPDPDDDGRPMDAAARRALDARLAQIRHDAHTTHASPRSGRPGSRLRPGQTEVYVHLTDHTLATGTGVLRAENIGPLLATQLSELVGHGPYTVKPVIDLNDAVSVDAYEIPDRIRERVRLTHPVELFPYGTRETHPAMDLDHIQP
ncbi:hypothetical protein AB0H36_48030, partial [Kribbella sp. NPDC050820]